MRLSELLTVSIFWIYITASTVQSATLSPYIHKQAQAQCLYDHKHHHIILRLIQFQLFVASIHCWDVSINASSGFFYLKYTIHLLTNKFAIEFSNYPILPSIAGGLGFTFKLGVSFAILTYICLSFMQIHVTFYFSYINYSDLLIFCCQYVATKLLSSY